MPLYEYQCDACGGRFEVIQKFSETTDQCRRCGKGPVKRLMSSPAIQFKGTGWYITDYAQKGKSGGGEASSSGSDSTSEKKADAPKTDSASKPTDTTPAASSTTPSSSKD